MASLNHWDIMKEQNPELFDKVLGWRVALTENEVLPRKYKELMMVAMCCVIRFEAGLKTHAEYALNHGATKEELFATIAQTMTIGGIPAFREGITTVKELL